jgi:hypothetical protein
MFVGCSYQFAAELHETRDYKHIIPVTPNGERSPWCPTDIKLGLIRGVREQAHKVAATIRSPWMA